jgi:hypothetical protein
MAYILQVDFPHEGIFGEEFSNAFKDLATDISNEDGLLWKIWTENKEEKIAGGIYLFSNKEDAKRYLDKHTERLESFGYKDIRAKIFDVNLPLSKICKANFLK